MITNTKKISLVKDAISKKDIAELVKWLKKNEQLTKGKLTIEFENKWSNWLGRKHSLFVNSGSSANLLMIYALMLSQRLKNKKIIVPSVSWVTTVAPIIQLGLEPILCDADTDTLGVDIDHLRKLIHEHKPSALMIVHILGFPGKMDEIIKLCGENDVILLEDSCESVGSTYKGVKTGNFGLMSAFSMYYGHHFSTIEGGLISTDDDEIYNILLSIRSHGWDRDLDHKTRKDLREKYNVDEFKALYTFYYPGFNLRSTDLQAKIGLLQLEKLDSVIEKRKNNFLFYDKLIINDEWKIKMDRNIEISNFAYPIIHKNINIIVKNLQENNIDCRPLVCGSIGRQPFFTDLYGKQTGLDFADVVHDYGLYIPNNPDLTEKDIIRISKIVNNSIKYEP
jgi:CDP-6-deoxy-D-xylo-4-hexulose-3-dehydrase